MELWLMRWNSGFLEFLRLSQQIGAWINLFILWFITLAIGTFFNLSGRKLVEPLFVLVDCFLQVDFDFFVHARGQSGLFMWFWYKHKILLSTLNLLVALFIIETFRFDIDDKLSANVELAFNFDRATHFFNDLLAYREPQPGAWFVSIFVFL